MDRLLGYIEIDDAGCWLWTASLTTQGYGRLNLNGQHEMAHRVTWVIWNGPVPDGLELDHLCRVRRCVNPQHLEAVTHGENIKRGILGGSRCAHPWSDRCYVNGKNIYCKACRRERRAAARVGS